MRGFEFYIFDLDNTLVDSRMGYEEAFIKAFDEFDIPYDPTLYNEYIRTPLSMTFSKYYPDSPTKYRDFQSIVIDTYERTCLNSVRLFPDARRCLSRLYRSDVGLGIVSNSYMSQINKILMKLGINDNFISVVGRDRVVLPKPDPEPVLLCMSEMGASSYDSVMVGDSVNDILAGKGANIFSILINRYGEDVHCYECDFFITSLDEL